MEPNMTGNEDYGPKKRGGGGSSNSYDSYGIFNRHLNYSCIVFIYDLRSDFYHCYENIWLIYTWYNFAPYPFSSFQNC